MKLLLKVIAVCMVVFFLLIWNVVATASRPLNKEKKAVEDVLIKKNYRVKSIHYYNGSSAYFISKYDKKGVAYYGVLNEKYQMVMETPSNRIKDSKILLLKDTDKVTLGYEDGFVYEVKRMDEKQLRYSYYNAETLKLIREIKL